MSEEIKVWMRPDSKFGLRFYVEVNEVVFSHPHQSRNIPSTEEVVIFFRQNFKNFAIEAQILEINGLRLLL